MRLIHACALACASVILFAGPAAADEIHPGEFEPDVIVSIGAFEPDSDVETALFTIPANAELRIRVRAEREGRFWFSLIPPNRRFFDENVYVRDCPVTPEGAEYVFVEHEFLPHRQSRPFQCGSDVHVVAVWGFDTGALYLDEIVVSGDPDAPGV